MARVLRLSLGLGLATFALGLATLGVGEAVGGWDGYVWGVLGGLVAALSGLVVVAVLLYARAAGASLPRAWVAAGAAAALGLAAWLAYALVTGRADYGPTHLAAGGLVLLLALAAAAVAPKLLRAAPP